MRKIIAETVGVPLQDVRTRMDKLAAYEANAAAENFVQSHPEYHAVPRNGALIQNAMKEANMECTIENITKVYTSLREKGLLIEKPAEIDAYRVPLQTLKNLANNTDIHEPEAGDGWDF